MKDRHHHRSLYYILPTHTRFPQKIICPPFVWLAGRWNGYNKFFYLFVRTREYVFVKGLVLETLLSVSLSICLKVGFPYFSEMSLIHLYLQGDQTDLLGNFLKKAFPRKKVRDNWDEHDERQKQFVFYVALLNIPDKRKDFEYLVVNLQVFLGYSILPSCNHNIFQFVLFQKYQIPLNLST